MVGGGGSPLAKDGVEIGIGRWGRVGLEREEDLRHAKTADAIGDRVMQAGDQRTRAISEAGDKHEAPGRTPRWKRGHVDLGGEVEQRPAIAGCRDRDFDDVVRQVEVRIDLPAQRLDRAGSVDDPLDEARHGGDSGRHLASEKVEVHGSVEERQQAAPIPNALAVAPHGEGNLVLSRVVGIRDTLA